MTTALEMIPAIGVHVTVRCEQMQVECIVKNVKNSWGQPRLLVAPVAGGGEQWVEMGRVSVLPRPACHHAVRCFYGDEDKPQAPARPAREGFHRPALNFGN